MKTLLFQILVLNNKVAAKREILSIIKSNSYPQIYIIFIIIHFYFYKIVITNLFYENLFN